MFKGRVFQGEWQMRLNVALSGSPAFPGVSSIGTTGTIGTSYVNDYVAVLPGIELIANTETNGVTVTGEARFLIDALGVDETWPLTSQTVETYVHMEGVKLYCENTGVWRIEWASIKWYVDSVLRHSVGAGGITSGTVLRPSAIPLLGIMPDLYASAGQNLTRPQGCLPPGREPGPGGLAAGSVVGGWRIRPAGETDWVAPPISYPSAPSGSPATGQVAGDDTWSAELSVYALRADTGSTLSDRTGTALVRIYPGLDRGVVRMDPGDYLAMVDRYGLPRVSQRDAFAEIVNDCTGEEISVTSDTADSDPYPLVSFFRGEVEEGPHAIEDVFSRPILCPVEYGGLELFNTTGTTGSRTRSRTLGGNHLFAAGSTDAYLTHLASWLPVFNDTWPHPHWSFFLRNPRASDPTAQKWKIDGAATETPDYFLPARQQHMADPVLPGGGSKRRNHVLAEPVTNNGLEGLISAPSVYNGPTFWWGVSRFDVQVPSLPTTFGPDETSASLYSSEQVDPLTVDADGVRIAAGSGPETLTIDYDLGSFTTFPYQTPHLAREVQVQWTGATSVEVYLVGADGTAVLINPDGTQGWKTYLRKHGAKYTHSGQNDFGQGYLADAATEWNAAISLAPDMASDAERSYAPGLLDGRTAVKLRFVVTRDPAVALLVRHPVFRGRAWNLWKGYPETAQHLTAICDAGPGVRLGTWQHWNYVDDVVQDPPTVRGQTTQSTVWDWLRSKRLAFEQKDPDDGLSAEIETIYEKGPDREYTLDKHLARDADGNPQTSYFWAPGDDGTPVACLVSSLREPPPLALFPRRRRTAAGNWAETGPYALYSYSHCVARRWHVSPKAVRLKSGGADLLTTAPGPAGWSTRWHERPTDGTEGLTFELWDAARWYAKVRPWRGFLLVPGLPAEGRPPRPALAARRDGSVFAFLGADFRTLGRADPAAPTAFLPPNDVGIAAVSASLSAGLGSRGSVWLGRVAEDGTADLRETLDLGLTWSQVITLPSCDDVAICRAPDGRLLAFTAEGGTVRGRAYSPTGDALGSSWDTSVAGLSPDARISAACYPRGESSFGIDLAVQDGGASYVVSSTDGGRTFA